MLATFGELALRIQRKLPIFSPSQAKHLFCAEMGGDPPGNGKSTQQAGRADSAGESATSPHFVTIREASPQRLQLGLRHN